MDKTFLQRAQLINTDYLIYQGFFNTKKEFQFLFLSYLNKNVIETKS